MLLLITSFKSLSNKTFPQNKYVLYNYKQHASRQSKKKKIGIIHSYLIFKRNKLINLKKSFQWRFLKTNNSLKISILKIRYWDF